MIRVANTTKRDKTSWRFKKKGRARHGVFHEKIQAKKAQKSSVKDIHQKQKKEDQNQKTNSIIEITELDSSLACSIKCLAV